MKSSNTRASRKRIPILEYLGVLALLAFVTWFLLWPAFQNVRDSFGVSTWVKTKAKITKSTKRRNSHGDGKTSITYRFRYEYQVDDIPYTGWRYSLAFPGGSQSAGVKAHQSGETIEVYYNPNHPKRSVVNIQASAWWNYLVLGITLLVGGVLALVNIRFRLDMRQTRSRS